MSGPVVSRRAAIFAGAPLAAAALSEPAPASAATKKGKKANKYKPSVKVPSADTLHMAKRFSFGYNVELRDQIAARGGPKKWFEWQLSPERIKDPNSDAVNTWWKSLSMHPGEVARRTTEEYLAGWPPDMQQATYSMVNYRRWTTCKQVLSQRQVLEVMTAFWEWHLYVPSSSEVSGGHRHRYGQLIREHALGRFDDMLFAATTSSAMTLWLTNTYSTKTQPNENLARELLELHTVGTGKYNEDDVKQSAHILTGWRNHPERHEAEMWEDAHYVGPVKVMGFTHPNDSADATAVTKAYVKYLAHHPSTAQRIAHKLAVRFVSTTPSKALVNHLASVYLKNDTKIKPVLRALVAHKEFWSSKGTRLRTPLEDVVAAHRALLVKPTRPSTLTASGPASIMYYQAAELGEGVHTWPRPDGPPDDNVSWASANRMMASFAFHSSLAHHWVGAVECRRPVQSSWVPKRGRRNRMVRFDRYVDHCARRALGVPATKKMVKACAVAVDVKPYEWLPLTHAAFTYRQGAVLGLLLDSPQFMLR